MATIEECREALDQLSGNLARAEGGVRGAAALDRSLSCHITDLDRTFTGRLEDGRIRVDALVGPPAEKAEIRLAMTGDDLVALVAGDLKFAKAWASGRVRLEAGLPRPPPPEEPALGDPEGPSVSPGKRTRARYTAAARAPVRDLRAAGITSGVPVSGSEIT